MVGTGLLSRNQKERRPPIAALDGISDNMGKRRLRPRWQCCSLLLAAVLYVAITFRSGSPVVLRVDDEASSTEWLRKKAPSDGGDDQHDDSSTSVCDANPYASSLKDSLDGIAERANGWMTHSLPAMRQRAYNASLQASLDGWNHERFFPIEEMSSCDHSCVGGGCGDDRSKIVCGLESLNQKEECVVYSIGGNNYWGFEKDLLKKTPCEIHTFDCTGPLSRFQKPDDPRLHFHHVCLASEARPAPEECKGNTPCGEMMTIEGIQRKLGHSQIDLFKMDIEGFEWQIFDSWPFLSDVSAKGVALPMQVLVEVHYRTQFDDIVTDKDRERGAVRKGRVWEFKFARDLVDLQERLLRMGYAVIVRDDNKRCKHCTELTLIRFQCNGASV